MKSFVLHGENTTQSRLKLSQTVESLRKNGYEVLKVDGTKTTQEELLALSRSQSLLGQDQAILVEEFLSQKKAENLALKLAKSGSLFLFWERKKLSPAKIKNLQKAFEVREFKIPATVFAFLDSLAPDNSQASLKLLRRVLKKDSSEFLLYMLALRVRQLIWARQDPDTLKLPPWQKKKLLKQAENWDGEQLISLHGKLLELDRMNKRSKLPEDLASSLDLTIASL